MGPAPSIDLNLGEKLKDKSYRRRFFWAESSALTAAQLIALRKRRGLNQRDVADMVGTKQPAISRVEQADYQNWNLVTLRAIVEALDGRLRVIIEPAEDVLGEYDLQEQTLEMVKSKNITTNELTPAMQHGYVYDQWDIKTLLNYNSSNNVGALPTQSVVHRLTGLNVEFTNLDRAEGTPASPGTQIIPMQR
jgi:transcriptional regulator with XRE-family HTH domain